jgi:hypothetical protein
MVNSISIISGGVSAYLYGLTRVFSFLALLWFVASSLANVLFSKESHSSQETWATFYPDDIINLVFGAVAVLPGSVKKVRASKFFLPCRSGMLLFILYNAIAAVYANTNGRVVVLLLLAIAALLTLVEAGAYQKLLEQSPASTRLPYYAFILIVLSGVFLLRAGMQLVSKTTTPAEQGVALADILLSSLWLANGIGFSRNPERCFLAASICCIHDSLFFLALEPLLLDPTFCVVYFVMIDGMNLAFSSTWHSWQKRCNRALTMILEALWLPASFVTQQRPPQCDGL